MHELDEHYVIRAQLYVLRAQNVLVAFRIWQ
jgi:hypothetical protein